MPVLFDVGGRDGFRRPSFHGEIGLHVLVSRRWLLVPEPQRDDRDIDSRLEHMHGRRMSNDMGRNSMLRELRADGGGMLYSELQASRHCRAGHTGTGPAGKQRRIRLAIDTRQTLSDIS